VVHLYIINSCNTLLQAAVPYSQSAWTLWIAAFASSLCREVHQ
jgi:hypothetical protein